MRPVTTHTIIISNIISCIISNIITLYSMYIYDHIKHHVCVCVCKHTCTHTPPEGQVFHTHYLVHTCRNNCTHTHHLEGQVAASHSVDVGRKLVGVTSVLEREIKFVGSRHHSGGLLVLCATKENEMRRLHAFKECVYTCRSVCIMHDA
jgi:hypothetical protein